MVLTGHLDDFTLPELVRTLHGQRKTGRLQIDYPEQPAALYFEGGLLVDAQLGNLTGLAALFAALPLPGASFNFNPLIRPPRRTVAEHERLALQELLTSAEHVRTLDAAPASDAGLQTLTPGEPAALTAPAAAGLATREFAGNDLLVKLAEVEATVAAQVAEMEERRALYWAIRHVETGRFLGYCELVDLDWRHHRGELGFIIAREGWGQGYATEAATALRTYAFKELRFERLIHLIAYGNEPSVKVAENIGARYVREVGRGDWKARLYAVQR
jgi:RimJ/RimL family protein N-acetyltransferase